MSTPVASSLSVLPSLTCTVIPRNLPSPPSQQLLSDHQTKFPQNEFFYRRPLNRFMEGGMVVARGSGRKVVPVDRRRSMERIRYRDQLGLRSVQLPPCDRLRRAGGVVCISSAICGFQKRLARECAAFTTRFLLFVLT
ncbi:uncharacterized protein MYCFIDRAFT_211652 [Pseudocercospora fijiensis CIRAD86]|uniref:Uncharacterized protein n=1 Tax=Pseudocercospora fijiensis (strain CIRAD86) TaxID=383855 RepID=M2YSP2_PSEFD|nr:uncharacterized protein MYCFIDRAFT_211652 [Pseudocercospora fijiensis CIRAD86]EME80725.1 hypothetical protein MYCFIDRAFT_211652 [Pseudocercospora fijiensis CIRAD86]